MAGRMHPDEIDSDADLVRHLLAAQQPQWAHLPIRRVRSTGTDNALYRLGDNLVARLPLRPNSTRTIDREHRWLPALAPNLPLPIPVPLALGQASERYPWRWSVYPWFEGQDGTEAAFDQRQLALDLAGFVAALRRIDPSGGPAPSDDNYGRGVALAARDALTRRCIDASRDVVDVVAIIAAWDQSRRVVPWEGPPVWLHGDIAAGNLLFRDGRLSAVIDWGCMAVGDPACDLVAAWELLDVAGREILRTELGVDDATWERGRGWALSTAICALPYYAQTNAFMAAQARHKLQAVLSEE